MEKTFIKNHQPFLKKNLPTFVYFILTIFFISPQLSIHSPTLIDDGSDLLKAIDYSYLGLLIKELFYDPRTKPLLLIFRKISFDLFGTNLAYHYLLQSLFLFLTSSLVFRLLKKIKVNEIIAFVAGLLIFVLPATVANYYRLGASEHLQLLFLLIALINIEKKHFTLFFLALACLMKENSIFFLLIPLINDLLNRKIGKHSITNLILLFGFSSLILYKMLLFKDTYIGQAYFSIKNIVPAIMISPITFVIMAFTLIYIIKAKNRSILKTKNEQLCILIAFFTSFITFFIWKANQFYYHLTSEALSIIVFSILINQFIIKNKKNHFINLTSFIIFLFFLNNQVSLSIREGIMLHKRQIAESALTSYILKNNWTNYSVYSNVNEFEKNHKIYLYFTDWQKQNKIKKFYPSMDVWLDVDYRNGTSLNEVSKIAEKNFYLDKDTKKILIKKIDNKNDNKKNNMKICGKSILFENYCEYSVSY